MLEEKLNEDGCVEVVVENSMTVYEAEKLCEEWAACFSANSNTNAATGVVFDLGHVGACDITGVQLLCSARKTAELNHKIFSVSEASAAVIEAVSEAGLEPEKLFAAA